MMNDVIVRQATTEDYQDCVGMSVDFMKMTPYSANELDYASLGATFIRAVNDGLAFVAEDDGDVCGMLIAHKVPAFFNNSVLIAQEIGWWVDDDYRDTKAGGMLLNAFESEAFKTCKYTVMSLLSTSPEQLKGYLNYRGYVEKEHSYFKENT